MADYIDRSAAIEALRKFADDCPGSTEAATAAAMAISVLSRVRGPLVNAEMALLKLARVAEGHGKTDNWVDLAGYAACGAEIESSGAPEVEK